MIPGQIDTKRWASMPLMEQMANIGSEVGRTAKWVAKGNFTLAGSAYLRALDLFDATIQYGRAGLASRANLLKELCRARDMFTEAYLNHDSEPLSYLDAYFGHFAVAVRHRQR